MTDAKVTISRETLERAIEALETCTPGDYSTGHVIHPGFHELAIETALTDLQAALAAQPVEPVALDTACMTEQAVDEYLSDYTMDGESEFHLPTETELALIKDAIMGLLVDPDFLAAFAPLTEPELRAGISIQLLEIKRLREKYAAAQHAADCLDAKCSALEIELERTKGELEGADALHEAEKQMHRKTRKLLDQSVNTNDERNAL